MSCNHNCSQGKTCTCTATPRVIGADGLTIVQTDVELDLRLTDLLAVIVAVGIVAALIL